MRAALVGFTVLAACEASPHVNVTFRGMTLDPAKLHVQVRDEHQHEWDPASVVAMRAAPDGVACELSTTIGTHVSVFVRGWYDANGNGRLDPGEPFGELGSAVEAVDHGGCSEREPNRAPDLVLASFRE